MIFSIGDIVSLESNRGNALYKVLDVWPNGSLKKVKTYGRFPKITYSSTHSKEWDSLGFKLYESIESQPTGPYAHVIRKIKIMDKRFEERKLA